MTIVDEIQRIKNNISNAYDICEQKGATIPDPRNSENLASCIVSITSGGDGNTFGIPLEIDSDGNLSRPSDYTWTSDAAKTISEDALRRIFYCSTSLKSVDLPLVETIKRHGLANAFENCTSLQNVNTPNLKTIEQNGMEYSFLYCSSLKEVSFPELTTVGDNGMALMCENCRGLTSVNFPKLEEVQGAYGLSGAFSGCSSLPTINFPNLTEVQSYGLQAAFSGCSSLSTVNLPELVTVYSYGLYNTFYNCRSITDIAFPKLTTLHGKALLYTFRYCTNLKHIYFNGLTEETFSSTTTDMFNNMLSDVTGCTVHFPANLSTILSSYSDVINGFGGTDTTVVFDINGATINFIVSNSDNYNILVNGKEAEPSAVYDLTDKKYVVLDSNTNKIAVGNLNNLQFNSNTDITVDFSQNFKRVNVRTNASDASVVFDINGVTIPAKTDDNINYYLEISGQNTDVTCIVSSPGYVDGQRTVTFDGEDINVTQRAYPATGQNFSQVYLTEDGTMGGNSFAVTCDTTNPYGYPAYKALDSDSYSYALVNKSPYSYTLYSPSRINITKLQNSFDNFAYPSQTIIYGSNDGQDYTQITTASFNKNNQSITLPNTEYYNYYKLVFNGSVEFDNMEITATELIAKKSLTYKITANNTYSVYFNDTELTQDTGGLDDCFVAFNDEDILETNVFKIVQNGSIVYQTLVDFNGVINRYIEVDLTQQCTLTLVPNQTASSYKYIVNGLESSESSNKITVVKGSTISYNIKYTDTNYGDSSGEITLNENKTINIVPKKSYIKVDLHPDTSRYAWREATIANPTSYAMYESTNKGVSNSSSMMKVTFKGYSSFTCYINSYAESRYDYTYATQLNQDLSNVSSDQKYSTSGNQKNPTSLSAFKEVTYTDLEPTSEYFFYVVYKKDGSGDDDNDRGYFIVDLSQESDI